MSVSLSMEELLAWNDESSRWWKVAPRGAPGSTHPGCGRNRRRQNRAGFVRHIWGAELRWAERLAGVPETPREAIPLGRLRRCSICTARPWTTSIACWLTRCRSGARRIPWTRLSFRPNSAPSPGARLSGTFSSTASVIGRNWPQWCARPARLQASEATCCSALVWHNARRRRRSTLRFLKARAAQYRPPLRGTERHRGLLVACRAPCSGLGAHAWATIGALGFALLAPLGIVLELFIVKKELFTRGEHKFLAAIDALQNSICKFHGRLPRSREN